VHSVHLQYTLSRLARSERVAHPLMDLLQAVAEHGSISAAAKQLDVPYRRAWEKVQEIERGLGTPVLVTAVGGAGGGGAQLTPTAQQAIAQFHAFTAGLEQEIEQRYAAAFLPIVHPP
jgi:molybdate transport system regulatory protein